MEWQLGRQIKEHIGRFSPPAEAIGFLMKYVSSGKLLNWTCQFNASEVLDQ
jgi:hypothetical protein